MSNYQAPSSGTNLELLDDAWTCCTPLAREPMDVEQAEQVAPLLKAIAEPARLRLLSIVLSHEGGEACVCDLMPYFNLSQPTISHHLKVLHDNGLVDREKRSTWVFYKARPEAMAAMATLFATVDLAVAHATPETAGAGA